MTLVMCYCCHKWKVYVGREWSLLFAHVGGPTGLLRASDVSEPTQGHIGDPPVFQHLVRPAWSTFGMISVSRLH